MPRCPFPLVLLIFSTISLFRPFAHRHFNLHSLLFLPSSPSLILIFSFLFLLPLLYPPFFPFLYLFVLSTFSPPSSSPIDLPHTIPSSPIPSLSSPFALFHPPLPFSLFLSLQFIDMPRNGQKEKLEMKGASEKGAGDEKGND